MKSNYTNLSTAAAGKPIRLPCTVAVEGSRGGFFFPIWRVSLIRTLTYIIIHLPNRLFYTPTIFFFFSVYFSTDSFEDFMKTPKIDDTNTSSIPAIWQRSPIEQMPQLVVRGKPRFKYAYPATTCFEIRTPVEIPNNRRRFVHRSLTMVRFLVPALSIYSNK